MASMTAQKPDGTKFIIFMEDCGDTVPAYAADGARFEAYTTRFWCAELGKEFYSQIPKSLVDSIDDAAGYRIAEDMCVVEDMLKERGFDPNTLRLDQ